MLIKRLVLAILLLTLGVGIGGVLGMVFSGDPTFVYVAMAAFLVFAVTIVVGSLRGRAVRRAKSSGDTAPAESPTKPTFPEVVAVLVVALASAVTLIPAYGSIGRAVESIAAGDFDGTSMATGNYQQVAVDAIAEVAGGYEFVSIQFYDTYVIASAPASPGSDTMDRYIWRYGHAYRDGPEPVQGEDRVAQQFDASKLDFSVVGQVTREVREDPELITEFALVDGAGVPYIQFFTTGEHGTIVYDFNGNLVAPN